MPFFRCLIEGESFILREVDDGDRHLMGFYVTRWVQASSSDEAKALVLNAIHVELEDCLDRYSPSPDGKVRFAEVVEVKTTPEINPGFVWFQMDE